MAYLERSYRRTNVYTNYLNNSKINITIIYRSSPPNYTTTPPIAEVVSVETINEIEEDPESVNNRCKLVPE